MKTIKDFFDHCGGTKKVANDLNLHQITIEGWKRRGIPWHLVVPIRAKYSVEPEVIEKLNASLKVRKNGKS